LFLLTALGFASVSFALRRIVPWPEDQGLWRKWEYFREHKDEYNVVWIGTSVVFRDVDVPAIDAALAERGHDFRSFNFGIGGMGTYEQDFVLHKLLELEPTDLEYVILEGGPVGLGVHPRHIFQTPGDTNTMRSTFWHDARQTGKVLRQMPHLALSPWRKFELSFTHARLLGRKLSSYGFGPEIERAFEGFEPGPMLLERHGHLPYRELHFEGFLDDPEVYHELIAAIPEASALPVTLDDLDLATHRAQFAAAESRGVELIYIALPGSVGDPERQFLHAEGVIPTLWDFSQPSEYPDLFRIEHRWDEDHLNPTGVPYLTALLVERVTQHLESGE
jgi:hypothetical protein